MSSVAEHCENILSNVHAWMAGGAEAALAAGKAEIETGARGMVRIVGEIG